MASVPLSLLALAAILQVVTGYGADPPDYGVNPYGKLAEQQRAMRRKYPTAVAKTVPLYGGNLSCRVQFSDSIPTSVHKLRPSDIKVVGALGDSVTAAFGARSASMLSIMTEFRGISWSIGGDGTVQSQVTLPNVLKHFNPEVVGFATGTGRRDTPNSHLDVAKTGALVSDIRHQVDLIVERMKANTAINFKSDWKVVTLWIGANDLCGWCKKHDNESRVETYIGHIRESLDHLRASVPRVFVNIVNIIDVTVLYDLKGLFCSLLHAYECGCGTSCSEETRERTRQLARSYQAGVHKLVNSGRYDTTDDFTVVVQPFMEEFVLPLTSRGKPDETFFAPDCFHFSTRAHAGSAVALWNNMLEPVGKKQRNWDDRKHLDCPAKNRPYLATAKNSVSASSSPSSSGRLVRVKLSRAWRRGNQARGRTSPQARTSAPSRRRQTGKTFMGSARTQLVSARRMRKLKRGKAATRTSTMHHAAKPVHTL